MDANEGVYYSSTEGFLSAINHVVWLLNCFQEICFKKAIASLATDQGVAFSPEGCNLFLLTWGSLMQTL